MAISGSNSMKYSLKKKAGSGKIEIYRRKFCIFNNFFPPSLAFKKQETQCWKAKFEKKNKYTVSGNQKP